MDKVKEQELENVGGGNNKEFHGYMISEACVGCESCIKVCPIEAIHMVNRVQAAIDQDECIQCGYCADECPTNAIQMH